MAYNPFAAVGAAANNAVQGVSNWVQSDDKIPGINVGNAIRQITEGGDQDIFDNQTISGRPGQTNVLPGGSTPVSHLYGSTAAQNAMFVDNSVQAPGTGGNPGVYSGSPEGQAWAQQQAYAQQQAQARAAQIEAARRGLEVRQGGLLSGAESSIRGLNSEFGNQYQDLTNALRQGQNKINSGLTSNALNLRRGMASIASGLRQGIRSGAVNLANMNAMDSGAADAMARAFARQGNSQAANINNQSQLAQNELMTEQENLGLQRQQGLGRLQQWRDNKVRDISDTLWQQLQELDADAQNAGVGGFVDMGARDRLIGQANAQLQAVEKASQAELNNVRGLSQDQILAKAAEMDAAGAAAKNPFAFEGGTVQFGQQPQGPAGAPLGPIANAPRFRDETMYNPAFLREDELQR